MSSSKSRESLESGTVVLPVQQPPTLMIATMKESPSLSSVEVIPHVVPDVSIENSTKPGPSNYVNPKQTPKNFPLSAVRAEVESIGSDTLSVNTSTPVRRKPSETDERKSLLEVGRRPSSRRGSASQPPSPRPGSRGSSRRSTTRGSRRRRGSKEPITRGELLMELARHDSVQSRDSRRSTRDSQRDKSQSRRRKDSDSTSSSSTTSASFASAGENGEDISRKRRRGYMTAQEAVQLGDLLCGCVLKDKFFYFLKPVIFITIGGALMISGLAFTVLHFIYEDSLGEGGKNQPYFTWGPITLSTGVILFMVGLVWVPIKEQKWKDGTASPMLAALEKWRAENQEKEDLQMKDLGEVKTWINDENKTDETTFVAGENLAAKEGTSAAETTKRESS